MIAALGWAYAACASFWPALFQRDVVKHGIREAAGYRIGRAIHWRLPGRAALGVAVLSPMPLLVVFIFHGWLAVILLAIMAAAIIALWLAGPPGLRLVYAETKRPDGQTVFELKAQPDLWRALVVFIIFGLLPALGMGALLNRVFVRVLGG